jgi:hypothetical protein
MGSGAHAIPNCSTGSPSSSIESGLGCEGALQDHPHLLDLPSGRRSSSPEKLEKDRDNRSSAAARASAWMRRFPAEGEARHLPAHGRRPSQMDLFDYKPEMMKWYDKDLPDSIRKGQRLTTMTSGQARFPIAPSKFKFSAARSVRHVDEHRAPAEPRPSAPTTSAGCGRCTPRRSTTSPPSPHMQTGNQVGGRPCLGSWASATASAR